MSSAPVPAPARDAREETRGEGRGTSEGRERRRGPSAAIIARRFKPLVFLLALVPLAWLAWQLYADQVRGDLVKEIEIRTGTWALRFLAMTLAVTPLRRLTSAGWLQLYRRMLGLFAFFYATVHFGVYLGLDLELDWSEIGRSIAKRPYITIGFTAWLLLLPLAMTSTKGWIRRLGGARWNRLHRLVYATALLATVHYLWAVKKDTLDPLLYLALFGVLLGWRGWESRKRRLQGRESEASKLPLGRSQRG